jgi:ABC-type antimicrobial peptide transport system permease subunit
MQAVVGDSLASRRVSTMLVTVLAGVGLPLAAVGIYAVVAHSAGQRTREIGIRVALGAAPWSIVGMMLTRAAGLVGAGLVIGSVISLRVSRFVASALYGISPRDLETFIGAAAVLTVIGGLAASVPAWRASRINPAVILRES